MKLILVRFVLGLCACGAGALLLHTVPEVLEWLFKFCLVCLLFYGIGWIVEGALAEYGYGPWLVAKDKAGSLARRFGGK
jgi:hypothetical protein